MAKAKFIPALRYKFLTPFFDSIAAAFLKEEKLKQAFIDASEIKNGSAVLDFGCGTGTLALMIKRRFLASEVFGVDVDPDVLSFARKKATRERLDVRFDEYDGVTLPYADGLFDSVVSSFVVHHLSTSQKARAFREILRVLKPGGRAHVLDLSEPRTTWARLGARALGRFEPIDDNISGKIPKIIEEAGFVDAGEAHAANTVIGTLSIVSGKKT